MGGDQSRYPVIFTAHSLPERIRDMGDTYPEQLQESAALVAAAADLDRWQVAWQSAGRTPEPWLGPDIRDVVRQLAAGGGSAPDGSARRVGQTSRAQRSRLPASWSARSAS